MHEAEVMMKLDHPNIVRIIGNPYFLFGPTSVIIIIGLFMQLTLFFLRVTLTDFNLGNAM